MRFFILNIAPTLLEIALVIGTLLFNYGAALALMTLTVVVLNILFSTIATDWRTQFVREAARADSAVSTISINKAFEINDEKLFRKIKKRW